MPGISLPDGPRTFGDVVSERLNAREADYRLRFVETVDGSLARLHRDGNLAPGNFNLNDARSEARSDEASRLARNLPVVRAFRDEVRDTAREAFRDAPVAEQSIIFAANLVAAGRIEAGRTFRFDDDSSIRLRGVVNGRTDRIEARYARPTDIGNLEVATALRRGIVRPGYTARVGLRQPCSPRPLVCGSIDLVSETQDDVLRTRVVALTGRRLYKDGWMLTGGVERVQNAQARDTRVMIGAIYTTP